MPTCKSCGEEHDATDLVRHEGDGVLHVHCPNCECVMGFYRDRALRTHHA